MKKNSNEQVASANALVFPVAFILMQSEVLMKPVAIIYGIGNFSVGYDLIHEYFGVYAGQSTDLYLPQKFSRIQTESLLGVKLMAGPARATAECRVPLNKGYYNDTKPYLNLGLSVYLQ